jgi:hypothetical protein
VCCTDEEGRGSQRPRSCSMITSEAFLDQVLDFALGSDTAAD